MQEILVRPAVYSLNKRKWIEQDLIRDAHLHEWPLFQKRNFVKRDVTLI